VKNTETTVGDRIAATRDKYNLSQAQLGANLGVTRAAISLYEKNKAVPRPEVVDRLAALFNADPEWFDRGRGKGPTRSHLRPKIANVEALLRPQFMDVGYLARTNVKDADTVAILAPNDAGSVRRGDNVVIDIRRREGGGDGVFLIVDGADVELRQWDDSYPFPDDARILGRAIAVLRAI
jgi:transcriptional regulator with XRE-family HTH domain